MEIAQRIRGIREDKDLKQSEIANVLNTTQQYYSEYENGKREIPTRHITKLCQFYNLSADYILCLIDEPKKLNNRP